MNGHASHPDPYLQPQTSVGNRLARALWQAVYVLLFRPSPRPLHAWRAFLLRLFGARLGAHCHIYPGARIWAPWNLVCEECACVADEANIYNIAPVHLGSHAIVSQQAYLCTATHDIDDDRFPLVATPIHIGDYAWICARASVMPGVVVRGGAVLALGAVATRSLDDWTVYAGVPAKRVRKRHHGTSIVPASEPSPPSELVHV